MNRKHATAGKLFTVVDDAIRLRVKVIPGANANAVVGVRGGELVVKVKERAERGRANRELLRFLAEWAQLPRKDMVILCGERSRRKVVSLPLAAAGPLRHISS